MLNFYTGTRQEFSLKPIFERVLKNGEHYDGMCYGFYWLRWGMTVVLLKTKLPDFLLTDGPSGWDEGLRND